MNGVPKVLYHLYYEVLKNGQVVKGVSCSMVCPQLRSMADYQSIQERVKRDENGETTLIKNLSVLYVYPEGEPNDEER